MASNRKNWAEKRSCSSNGSNFADVPEPLAQVPSPSICNSVSEITQLTCIPLALNEFIDIFYMQLRMFCKLLYQVSKCMHGISGNTSNNLERLLLWRIQPPVLGEGATWRGVPTQGTTKTENSTDSTHYFLGWTQIHFRKNKLKAFWDLLGGAKDIMAPLPGLWGAWPVCPSPLDPPVDFCNSSYEKRGTQNIDGSKIIQPTRNAPRIFSRGGGASRNCH